MGLPSATGRNQGGLGMQTLLTTEAAAQCRNCHAVNGIDIVAESFRAYIEGAANVQEAFPSLSADHRELLMQVARRMRGEFHWYLCPECWEKMGEA